MEPLKTHEGVAVCLAQANIDTDQIIPKQFLKQTSRTGFGQYLFYDWRFLDNGQENPTFVLNRPAFRQASILVAGDNFGCGSSREHAPWAIQDYGFRVIVSTRFADIFFNNCFKNGILPIIVAPDILLSLMREIEENEGVRFRVDLERQLLTTPGGQQVRFSIDPSRKQGLLEGKDEIAGTLQFEAAIGDFEKRQQEAAPWLW
jgi:3-isopropylmalate/(R)-2-methylmalate dehydratase small subunit